MPIKAGSFKRIFNPDDDTQYIDIPIVDVLNLQTGQGKDFQRRFITFINNANADRVVEVKTVTHKALDRNGNTPPEEVGDTDDSEQKVEYEFIKEFHTKKGSGVDFQRNFIALNADKEERDDWRKTHRVRITGKDDNDDCWIDIQRTDRFALKHGQGADFFQEIYDIVWNDTTFDATEGVTTNSTPKTGFDPPYRLDPIQDIVNVKWRTDNRIGLVAGGAGYQNSIEESAATFAYRTGNATATFVGTGRSGFFGAPHQPFVTAACVDNKGAVITGEMVSDPTDIFGHTTVPGFMLSKFSSSGGSPAWSAIPPTAGAYSDTVLQVIGVAADRANSIYVLWTQGTNSGATQSVLLSKFSSGGGELWRKSLVSGPYNGGGLIAVPSGGCVVAYSTDSVYTLVRYDTNGATVWSAGGAGTLPRGNCTSKKPSESYFAFIGVGGTSAIVINVVTGAILATVTGTSFRGCDIGGKGDEEALFLVDETGSSPKTYTLKKFSLAGASLASVSVGDSDTGGGVGALGEFSPLVCSGNMVAVEWADRNIDGSFLTYSVFGYNQSNLGSIWTKTWGTINDIFPPFGQVHCLGRGPG